MKKEDIPQDDENMLEGKMNMVNYAVGEDGKYEKAHTKGWEPENVALKQAWELVEERVKEARQKVLDGKVSPIAFHMEKNQMDVALLAQYVSFSRWRIKWHLRPSRFKKLSNSSLQEYADAFNITIEELKSVDL